MLSALAPAKLNLSLQVTGKRADGYHLLDSLVVFADVGDVVSVAAQQSPEVSLHLTGPYGHVLAAMCPAAQNLVVRAIVALQQFADVSQGAAITIEKNLPLSSGIGGGSSDAATAVLLAHQLWGCRLDVPTLAALLLPLGADIPVCLTRRPMRMQGVGEVLTPVAFPSETWHVVLVNPGVAVPTAPIFQAGFVHYAAPQEAPDNNNSEIWLRWLQNQQNMLTPAAIAHAPVIAEVLVAMQQSDGCVLARMSGSGATCFGLFRDAALAAQAASILRNTYPWVVSAPLYQLSA